jgi:hypothetical protein
MSLYADRVTFVRGRFNGFIYRNRLIGLAERFAKLLQETNEREKAILIDLERIVLNTGMKHIIRTSPPLMLPVLMGHLLRSIWILPMVCAAKPRGLTALRQRLSKWGDELAHPLRVFQERAPFQLRLIDFFFSAPIAFPLDPEFYDRNREESDDEPEIIQFVRQPSWDDHQQPNQQAA